MFYCMVSVAALDTRSKPEYSGTRKRIELGIRAKDRRFPDTRDEEHWHTSLM